TPPARRRSPTSSPPCRPARSARRGRSGPSAIRTARTPGQPTAFPRSSLLSAAVEMQDACPEWVRDGIRMDGGFLRPSAAREQPAMPQATSEPSAPAPLRPVSSGHADVNGIKLYHEIYGQGEPLVLLHGGLMTIS